MLSTCALSVGAIVGRAEVRPRAPVAFLMALATSVMLAPAPCAAFEGFEHTAIGNISYRLAFGIAGDSANAAALVEKLKELGLAPRNVNDGSGDSEESLTYGDIVQCVDTLMYPEMIIAAAIDRQAMNGGRKFLGWTASTGWARRNCTVGQSALSPETRHGGQLVRASHNNHTHFQSSLAAALQRQHFLALATARLRGDLALALLENAMGDHFLHDFFAPGHIATPRTLQTDLFATSLHDYYNRQGARFKAAFGKDGYGKFKSVARAVLNVLQARLQSGGDTVTENILWPRFGKDNPRFDETLKRTLTEILGSAVSDLQLDVEAGQPSEFILKGDDMLWREFSVCDTRRGGEKRCAAIAKEAQRQRLLMIIANTTSIIEVFEAWLGQELRLVASSDGPCHGNNPLGLARITDWPRSSRYNGQPDMTHPQLAFGGYDPDSSRPSYALEAGPEFVSDNGNVRSTSAPHAITEYFDTKPSHNIPLSLSLARESMNSTGLGRWTFDGEMIHYINVKERTEAWNTFYALGGGGYKEGSRSGAGVSARYGWTFPDIETTVSIYGRRRLHLAPDQRQWRNAYGVRADFGFTSMFGGFLSLANDFGFDQYGLGHRGWMFIGGVSLSAPLSRLNGD